MYNSKKINIWIPITLILLCIISPVLSLFYSILCYRSKISYVFFIYFAFYFGWFYEPQYDLLNHYNHFTSLLGKSLIEAWNDDGTHLFGKELYPVLFKYVIGKISDSANLFSGIACMVYALLFCGVLSSIKDLYVKKMNFLTIISFLGIIFTVEYEWFMGLRFWSGSFVFILFYIRYIRTNNKKFFFCSFLCLFFHFSLLVLCLVALVNEILKENFIIRYMWICVSFFVKYLQVPLLTYITQLPIFRNYVKASFFSDSIVESVSQDVAAFRIEGNQFYLQRGNILFVGCLLVFLILLKYDKKLIKYNRKLYGMILLLYGMSQFGYLNLIFYDRFYKITVLLTYIFLFIYLSVYNNYRNVRNKMLPILILSLTVFYAILTPMVAQRKILWTLDVWFNNWFF